MNGRGVQAVEQVAALISKAGADCLGVVAAVTSASELAARQSKTHDRFGEVDVLAALAGGMGNHVALLNMTHYQWRKVTAVDLIIIPSN